MPQEHRPPQPAAAAEHDRCLRAPKIVRPTARTRAATRRAAGRASPACVVRRPRRAMSSFAPPEADSAQTPVYGQEPEPEPELDGDGYRSLTLKQHVGRLLSVVVFVIMRPLGAAARG